MMPNRWIGNVLLVLTVAGCGAGDLADLERMVDEATRPSPHATSVPAEHREFAVEYGAMSERSPFEPFTEVRGAAAAEAPDNNRVLQPQERFPLGQLEMVGTLAGRDRILALIRDPHGITHPLAAGDYLGRDHGRITSVRESGIDILEHVEDGRGGWTTRARTLELSVPDIQEDGSTNVDNGDIEE